MSTNMACGEPHWYMKKESDSCFAELTGVYGASNDSFYSATIDGVAAQPGDLVMLKSTDAPLWVDPNPLPDFGSCTLTGSFGYSNDVAIVEDGVTISMKDMHARLERLERQVEMWKSAAMTLKEINDELQEAADADRQQALLDDALVVYHERRLPEPAINFGKPALDARVTAYLEEQRALAAYERAKKYTR